VLVCSLGCPRAFSVELCGVPLASMALNLQLFHRLTDVKREWLMFDQYLLWRNSGKKMENPVTPG